MLGRILGLVGSLLLVLGVGAPLVQLPFVGSLSYATIDRRGAVVLAMLGILGMIGSIVRRRIVSLIVAGAAAAMLCMSYVAFHHATSASSNGLSGVVASTLMAAIRFDWGILVLVAAIISVAASAFVTPEWSRAI
jgi:hypothetical protein